MSTPTVAIAILPVRPKGGCGTLESPWTGWEDQLEASAHVAGTRDHAFAAGVWGVSRPVRLATGTTLTAEAGAEGRPWFLPTTKVDTLFRIDGVHDVILRGLRLNGRDRMATHGIFVRAGTGLHIEACRFGDFADPDGAAVRLCGESEARHVKGVVLQASHFVNGWTGVRMERFVTDLLVTDNRFDEMRSASAVVDPHDDWASYGLIFVKNRIHSRSPERTEPMLDIGPGAEGLRVADNDFRGPDEPDATGEAWPAIRVRGGGRRSLGRIELMSNRFVGIPGSAVDARQCGAGFLAAANQCTACGRIGAATFEMYASHGILVEDNEIVEAAGPAIRIRDCSGARVNGNDIRGHIDASQPRAGSGGVIVEGDGARRLRLTDNRIHGVRDPGVRIEGGTGVRIVGNEIQDCGEGIRVAATRNLVLVGNDCRDNGGGGIRVEETVRRGIVALNYAILNGPMDLEVLGTRIACDRNKVDRVGPGSSANGVPAEGAPVSGEGTEG